MLRRFAYGSLFVLLAACGVVDEAGSEEGEKASTSPVVVSNVTNGSYVIKSVLSGKCLDVSGSSTENGAKVQEWGCNNTNAQKFEITNVGGDNFKIANINSKKVLDVAGVSYAASAPIHQWEYVGGANQQFFFVNRDGTDISIHARHTGMALDVAGWNQDDGTAILQYPWHGGANQRWTFEKVGDSGGGAVHFSGFASYNFYDNVPATSTKCNLDPAAYQYQVTALRTDIQDQLNACGKCARVTSKPEGGGNGNTVVVHIIDNSNDYSSNGGNRLLDIAPQAFDQIGDRDRGSIPIDFDVIDCP